ncbi:MAG TPA: DNA-binding transcriptional regulator OxyR [Gammaproteobacteria bacterium]|nr:DNA-binding transcriptional regulator OxyR [Gammaproteobacteria bacterium]
MNIRDLKYLVALSDHRHFGKAAEACFVSQPALSIQIKKLEETLGVKLLERTNKSVLLTTTGIIITERARHILQQVEEMRDLAKLAKDPYSGELKIGIIPTLAPYLLPLIIPSLSKKFSKISFYLIEEKTAVLIEKLKIGKLDAAFLALPIVETSFTTSLLFEEEFLLAVPSAHPLAKRKTIKQNDLDNQPVLLLEEGHCMREQTLALCHKMNATEIQNFRATSLETLRHMVAADNGITLMPTLACQLNDGISYIPFSSPKPMRSIALFWRFSTTKKILLEDIATQIRKTLTKQKTVTLL